MKAIKAVYNFIVGDMIILIGVLALIAVLALIHSVDALAALRPAEAVLLIVVVVVILGATLYREARGR
jgi:hypothetical protein